MKTLSTIALCALLTAVGTLLTGCETEPANSPVFIEPSAATVKAGQSVIFQAKGGYTHRWSVSDASIGYLSGAVGPTTTYTAMGAATNGSQTLTLRSTIDGVDDTGTATNSFSYEQTASAIITHL